MQWLVLLPSGITRGGGGVCVTSSEGGNTKVTAITTLCGVSAEIFFIKNIPVVIYN